MSFTWNSINCETLDMFVERYPNRPFPQRKVTVYSVAGRSGDLIVDENAFTNVIQEYEVFVKGGATLQTKLSTIASWLLGTAGYAELQDSYDTSTYRRARVANAIEFLNSLNQFGKGTIQFDCEPQRYPIGGEILYSTFSSTEQTITYPSGTGYLPAYPKITITGKTSSAAIKVVAKNLTVTITNYQNYGLLPVVIDFATQSVYRGSSTPSATTVTGTWDKLGDGDTVKAQNTRNSDSMTCTVDTRRFKL